MFGFKKKYPDYSTVFNNLIVTKLKMKPEFSSPFLTYYKDNFNMSYYNMKDGIGGASVGLQNVARQHGVDKLALVTVAMEAYLKDLMVGKYVNTVIEVAIIGILEKYSEILSVINPPLDNFIQENLSRKWPEVEHAFL